VRLQHKTLRIKGATNGAGFALTVLAATLVAFITHSALWQYHYRAGQSLYNNAQAQKLPDETSVREALAHFEWCESKGFFPVATLEASLGSSMAYLGNLKDGLLHLRRAVELNPKLAGARYQFARTLQMSGDLEGAAREFKIVEKQDPSNLAAKHDLALVLASAGKVAESERILQEIAAKDPKNVELLLELASAQYKLADYPAAERTIRSALTNAPDSAAAHYNLGLVLLESSKAEAMKEFQKAVALDGSLIDPRAALAQTYSDEGRHAEAAKAFDGALALAPYDPGLLASWAHELKISGQIGGTIRRLIRSDPSDEPAWYHAAVLYKASGNASAANALYRRLAMRNPNLPSLQP
jgi:tetratricopeptide (TPR) repeat protein